jgi:hypothetical protein
MLEKTQEELTSGILFKYMDHTFKKFDDVGEHIHQLGASKLKEKEEDTIIISIKICKIVVNVVTQMPTKVPQKLQT